MPDIQKTSPQPEHDHICHRYKHQRCNWITTSFPMGSGNGLAYQIILWSQHVSLVRPSRTRSFTGNPPQTSISKYFNSKHWRAVGLVVTDRRFLSRRSPLHKPISSQPLAHIHRGSVVCQARRTVWQQ